MKYVDGIGCVWDNPLHNEIEDLRRVITKMQVELWTVKRECDQYKARFGFIEEHAVKSGGGNGFYATFFVPIDTEDIGYGIDLALASNSKVEKKP